MHSNLHSNGDCLYFRRKLKDNTKAIEEILVFLKPQLQKNTFYQKSSNDFQSILIIKKYIMFTDQFYTIENNI